MTAPDPSLIERLHASTTDFDWIAARLLPRQYERLDEEWSAHEHLFHLLGTERHNFQPRLSRMLAEDRPVFEEWDSLGYMTDEYVPEPPLDELAAQFVAARHETLRLFDNLRDEDWARTGVWPAGEVDVAWVAGHVTWHSLDHLAGLLGLYQDLELRHAP